MSKPEFTFRFADMPQAIAESRSEIARLLRAYRRDRDSYSLTRVGPGCYQVFMPTYGRGLTAYLERRNPNV